MKTREEFVEELAKAIHATGVALDGTDYAFGVYDDDDHFHRMANALHAAGYRKQSDTVRDFAVRVKMAFYYEFFPSLIEEKIDELIEEVCGE